MEDSAFSVEFCDLLKRAVPSVSAAAVLVLLFTHPERRWSLSELLAELRPNVLMTESDASAYLEKMRACGLVDFDEDKRVRYGAASPLHAQVCTLAKAYNERPVTLVQMIYAVRDSNIKSFSDAFKFRNE